MWNPFKQKRPVEEKKAPTGGMPWLDGPVYPLCDVIGPYGVQCMLRKGHRGSHETSDNVLSGGYIISAASGESWKHVPLSVSPYMSGSLAGVVRDARGKYYPAPYDVGSGAFGCVPVLSGAMRIYS